MIWWFYRQLKEYKQTPSPVRADELRARFDCIFQRRTGYATLDRLLKRLLANKDELLLVLERPEMPLDTNASENDICAVVAKRKVSGGTVSQRGRTARDVMLGLAKTCAKLKISFFRDPGARLGTAGPHVPPLASMIAPTPACSIARKSAPVTRLNSNRLISSSGGGRSPAKPVSGSRIPC